MTQLVVNIKAVFAGLQEIWQRCVGVLVLVLVLVLDLDKLEVPPGEASTLWKHMALVSTLWLASHQGSVWLERLSRPDEVTGL